MTKQDQYEYVAKAECNRYRSYKQNRKEKQFQNTKFNIIDRFYEWNSILIWSKGVHGKQ
jgi:hypothetical protein